MSFIISTKRRKKTLFIIFWKKNPYIFLIARNGHNSIHAYIMYSKWWFFLFLAGELPGEWRATSWWPETSVTCAVSQHKPATPKSKLQPIRRRYLMEAPPTRRAWPIISFVQTFFLTPHICLICLCLIFFFSVFYSIKIKCYKVSSDLINQNIGRPNLIKTRSLKLLLLYRFTCW